MKINIVDLLIYKKQQEEQQRKQQDNRVPLYAPTQEKRHETH